MQKLLLLLFGVVLCFGVSSAGGQEKKPKTTLEEDWKTLCRYQWVNSNPKEAWALLDEGWKKFRARQGIKGWSKIEFSFKDGRPDKKDYRMTGIWYYQAADGTQKPHQAEYGVATDLVEEKGQRFLIRGVKVKYILKEGLLILNGVDDASKSAAPTIYTGEYKAIERRK